MLGVDVYHYNTCMSDLTLTPTPRNRRDTSRAFEVKVLGPSLFHEAVLVLVPPPDTLSVGGRLLTPGYALLAVV